MDSLDRWRKSREDLLEIENPGVQCGSCSFSNTLSGAWSVENGRLVFRADASPLATRGPDFHHCGECGAELTRITVGFEREPLAAEQVAALQASEREADEAEMRRMFGE